MFNLREYIKKGFLDAVGKMSDYQIILNSAGWMEKGVLTEEDLAEINQAIEVQYIVPVEPEEKISVEELVNETKEVTEDESASVQLPEENTEDSTEEVAEETVEDVANVEI